MTEKDERYRERGYVRLWRGFQDDPIYKKRRRFSQWEAWEWLYMEARGVAAEINFRRTRLKLERGQLITSQRELARRWRWTRGSVENFLRKLQRRGSIAIETLRQKRGFSIVTLLKFAELNPCGEDDLSHSQQRKKP